jgi:hypothetical protein
MGTQVFPGFAGAVREHNSSGQVPVRIRFAGNSPGPLVGGVRPHSTQSRSATQDHGRQRPSTAWAGGMSAVSSSHRSKRAKGGSLSTSTAPPTRRSARRRGRSVPSNTSSREAETRSDGTVRSVERAMLLLVALAEASVVRQTLPARRAEVTRALPAAVYPVLRFQPGYPACAGLATCCRTRRRLCFGRPVTFHGWLSMEVLRRPIYLRRDQSRL